MSTDSKEISLTNNEVKSGVESDAPAPKASSEGTRIAYRASNSSADDEKGLSDTILVWFNTPGKVGTYMSYFLIIVGMIGAIIGQKYAPANVHQKDWLENCPSGYESECKGNGSVYRFSFALFIIFALQVIGTTIDLRFYDALWVPKFCLFIGLVSWFYYCPSHVFDDHGYAWLARILAFFYIILQQIILIDFAYTWNDKWVLKAEEDGGNKWKIILLLTSFVFIAGSYSAIGVMWWQFGGCPESDTILSLSVILPTLATIYQLFNHQAKLSLLTSAIMFAYSTYFCYSALTLNPNVNCNPTIGGKYQTLSTIIGMVILVLTVTYSVSQTLTAMPAALDAGTKSLNKVDIRTRRSLLQQGGIVFTLVSCYFAMILTNWATLQHSFNLAQPKNGEVAMWLQASGQWVAIALYAWTMIAPKLFPDRDWD